AFVAALGSYDLPWVPYIESLYGYRYVEKLLVDRLNFGTTADWGLNANGKLGPDGALNYSVSAINGNGYKHPTRSKTVDFEGRLGYSPLPGLIVAVGGYGGKRGQSVEGSDTAHTASRLDAFVGYAASGLKVAAEYLYAKDFSTSGIAGVKLVAGVPTFAS